MPTNALSFVLIGFAMVADYVDHVFLDDFAMVADYVDHVFLDDFAMVADYVDHVFLDDFALDADYVNLDLSDDFALDAVYVGSDHINFNDFALDVVYVHHDYISFNDFALTVVYACHDDTSFNDLALIVVYANLDNISFNGFDLDAYSDFAALFAMHAGCINFYDLALVFDSVDPGVRGFNDSVWLPSVPTWRSVWCAFCTFLLHCEVVALAAWLLSEFDRAFDLRHLRPALAPTSLSSEVLALSACTASDFVDSAMSLRWELYFGHLWV